MWELPVLWFGQNRHLGMSGRTISLETLRQIAFLTFPKNQNEGVNSNSSIHNITAMWQAYIGKVVRLFLTHRKTEEEQILTQYSVVWQMTMILDRGNSIFHENQDKEHSWNRCSFYLQLWKTKDKGNASYIILFEYCCHYWVPLSIFLCSCLYYSFNCSTNADNSLLLQYVAWTLAEAYSSPVAG